MSDNSKNPSKGKKFQDKVKKIAEDRFNQEFIDEYAVPIGKPKKEHRFDLVSMDTKIVIECKCYTWTKGNNSPSAKMSTLNEAVLYMSHLSEDTQKIIAMKKDTNVKTSETLASYYVRRYGHLLNDIEVWEIDDNDMKVVRGESIVV